MKDCKQPWHWKLVFSLNETEQTESMEKNKVKWKKRQKCSFWTNESRARLLLSSHGQGNWWWSKWDARLYVSNFLAAWIAGTGFTSRIPCRKESIRAGLSWLEEWLRHPQQHKRTQQTEFCNRSSWWWWRSCQWNRAVYGQEEMDVEQRGLSLSSLHKVAIDTVIAVAFTKSHVVLLETRPG